MEKLRSFLTVIGFAFLMSGGIYGANYCYKRVIYVPFEEPKNLVQKVSNYLYKNGERMGVIDFDDPPGTPQGVCAEKTFYPNKKAFCWERDAISASIYSTIPAGIKTPAKKAYFSLSRQVRIYWSEWYRFELLGTAFNIAPRIIYECNFSDKNFDGKPEYYRKRYQVHLSVLSADSLSLNLSNTFYVFPETWEDAMGKINPNVQKEYNEILATVMQDVR